jgi:hypothetical protein
MHLDAALGAIRPARVGRNVLQDIVEASVAVASPHIAHSARVGERIESLDSRKIVLIW